jgi:hypothetical protein
MRTLTARTLTVWRKPWRKQLIRPARRLIADQSLGLRQPRLALLPPAGAAAATPPRGCPAAPPDARQRAAAAPSGSIDKAWGTGLGAPGAAAAGGGE